MRKTGRSIDQTISKGVNEVSALNSVHRSSDLIEVKKIADCRFRTYGPKVLGASILVMHQSPDSVSSIDQLGEGDPARGARCTGNEK
ncbi:hypothetical protein BJS_06021 [Bradyrhizobium japonicum SEMIA 5079]|nr:hypothetical protein BJS_06021 [Bradyrhizobium japonicum SEMIA 5079]